MQSAIDQTHRESFERLFLLIPIAGQPTPVQNFSATFSSECALSFLFFARQTGRFFAMRQTIRWNPEIAIYPGLKCRHATREHFA
jgi:hypothetical protein